MTEEKESTIARIYSLYQKANKKETIFTLDGNSMYPALQNGCKAKIRHVDIEEIKEGDIAVFGREKLICHRVMGKCKYNKKIYLIQKGDAQTIGGFLEEKDFLGKVVEVFDSEDKKVDEKIWQKPVRNSRKAEFLTYTYLVLALIKGFLFNRKQNIFTRWSRRFFWRSYQIFNNPRK